MKTWTSNTTRILSALFWATAAAYVLLFAAAFWRPSLPHANLLVNLALFLHAVPACLGQLALCRTRSIPVRILLPLGILVGVGLVWLALTQWSLMSWMLFGYWCIAPVTGCALGWAIYGAGYLLRNPQI